MDAFLLDYIRTPIGRYGGGLASVRPDDLAALAIATVVRSSGIDPERIDEVYFGDANQAGEDNRNVARMATLLAGLPVEVPGSTVNRLCGSGMEAVGLAARAVAVGAADVVVVVMGLQHHSELQLLGLQGRHHRFSHRWIDNGRLAASAIHQHKHIVVTQHG